MSEPSQQPSQQAKLQQQIRPLVLETMDRVGGYETAKGFLRYEAMRKLHLNQLAELHTRNLKGELMDDMIDQLILNQP